MVLWDRATGEPVHRAIVWQDRRTAEDCNELRNQCGMAEKIRSKTGLVIDPYFSGTKVRWALQNVRGLRQRAEAGEICFGTIDSWLVNKLTGGTAHITDYSNASRTQIYNIYELKWDEEMLDLYGIPKAILSEVVPSSHIYRETDPALDPGRGHRRPLVRSQGDKVTAALAREHVLMISDSNLVSITGGKWTTYRKMAEDTIDAAALGAGLDERPSQAKTLRLHGWSRSRPRPTACCRSTARTIRACAG